MAKFEDLKGQKFGYWTVVERAENHPAARSAQWLCECECGTKKIHCVMWGTSPIIHLSNRIRPSAV